MFSIKNKFSAINSELIMFAKFQIHIVFVKSYYAQSLFLGGIASKSLILFSHKKSNVLGKFV